MKQQATKAYPNQRIVYQGVIVFFKNPVQVAAGKRDN